MKGARKSSSGPRFWFVICIAGDCYVIAGEAGYDQPKKYGTRHVHEKTMKLW
jgi:hypothetical protein